MKPTVVECEHLVTCKPSPDSQEMLSTPDNLAWVDNVLLRWPLSFDRNEFAFPAKTHTNSNFIVIRPNAPGWETQKKDLSACLEAHFVDWKHWNGHTRAPLRAALRGLWHVTAAPNSFAFAGKQLFPSKQICQHMLEENIRSRSSVVSVLLLPSGSAS